MRFNDRQLSMISAAIATEGPVPVFEQSRWKNTESQSQQSLIRWWAFACKRYDLPEFALKASPLQGIRDGRTGARMKREGMRKGDLDLNLTVVRRPFFGLFIELKTEKGRVTPEQTEMMAHLMKQGYRCEVCRSTEAAQAVIEEYLRDQGP